MTEKLAGTYSCNIVWVPPYVGNPGDVLNEKTVTITVMKSFNCSTSLDLPNNPPPPATNLRVVQEGDRMYFQCTTTLYGPDQNITTLQWNGIPQNTSKKYLPPDNRYTMLVAESYIIARPEHNGQHFKCELSHPNVGVVATCTSNYTVYHRPQNLTISPNPGSNQLLAVNLGDKIVCQAEIAGFPRCSYYWFKVGNEDKTRPGQTLTITEDIMEELHGKGHDVTWACVARNAFFKRKHIVQKEVGLMWENLNTSILTVIIPWKPTSTIQPEPVTTTEPAPAPTSVQQGTDKIFKQDVVTTQMPNPRLSISDLSTYLIVGVIVACVVFLAIIGLVILQVARKKKDKSLIPPDTDK
jgi:hypothetical protein